MVGVIVEVNTMSEEHFNIMRNSPYASTTVYVELEEGTEMAIIHEFHDLDHEERIDRQAIFLNEKGLDIAHTYQPRDFTTGRFVKRVQIFGA